MLESTVRPRDAAAIDWLLTSPEPGIAMQARRDLIDVISVESNAAVMDGPVVTALLAGQKGDGGFGVHPYQKWMGAHWRLVSLVELGVPPGEPRVMEVLENVLSWIASDDPSSAIVLQGRPRIHGSIYANPLAAAVRLGRADDPRAAMLAEWLMGWQWDDGGWNCDRHPRVCHSSFYESITPLWALSEYAAATGDTRAADAAERTAQFFLAHHVYKSHTSDRAGDPKWLNLRYPEYWHFDYLHGLVMLARAGALPDPRADDALRLLRDQQQPDGRWVATGPQYWKGYTGLYGDAARWTRESVSQMLTLNALRVLRAAGS